MSELKLSMKCDHWCHWSRGNIFLFDTDEETHLKGTLIIGSVLYDQLLHLAFSHVLAWFHLAKKCLKIVFSAQKSYGVEGYPPLRTRRRSYGFWGHPLPPFKHKICKVVFDVAPHVILESPNFW